MTSAISPGARTSEATLSSLGERVTSPAISASAPLASPRCYAGNGRCEHAIALRCEGCGVRVCERAIDDEAPWRCVPCGVARRAPRRGER